MLDLFINKGVHIQNNYHYVFSLVLSTLYWMGLCSWYGNEGKSLDAVSLKPGSKGPDSCIKAVTKHLKHHLL